LVYLRARYYDPGTSQFTSTDPAVDATMSPYAYVAGSPLNRVDPSGLSFSPLTGGRGVPDPCPRDLPTGTPANGAWNNYGVGTSTPSAVPGFAAYPQAGSVNVPSGTSQAFGAVGGSLAVAGGGDAFITGLEGATATGATGLEIGGGLALAGTGVGLVIIGAGLIWWSLTS